MISPKKISLLGAGTYSGIPDEITLKAIPVASELDYVSHEDFDSVMLEKIFPKVIEESFDYKSLLEIDYTHICKELRILNYGPFFTTPTLLCYRCGASLHGRYTGDLRTLRCKELPKKFKNSIKISKEEFLDFPDDVVIKLPTIQQMLNARKDKAFQSPTGKSNNAFARMCYMIATIGTNSGMTPVEIKLAIEKQMSSADYMLLNERVTELTDYGLRAGGVTVCPKCGETSATYLAILDEKMFRPTIDDLRAWKALKVSESTKS